MNTAGQNRVECRGGVEVENIVVYIWYILHELVTAARDRQSSYADIAEAV